MTDGRLRAQAMSDEQIQAWADEAEDGYEVPRLGRQDGPPAGDGSGEAAPAPRERQ
ncbi:hypothetical protein ACIG47_05120 [Promicromonospora sp. NPDC052451]|uniref:hypothetical protein n=1 Tax=Promicromonospora sp. NPDC052451 TaxID=3364407 RepID=UPI0037C6A35C